MLEVSATEFVKNFGQYKERVQREIIAITDAPISHTSPFITHIAILHCNKFSGGFDCEYRRH